MSEKDKGYHDDNRDRDRDANHSNQKSTGDNKDEKPDHDTTNKGGPRREYDGDDDD